MNNIYNAIQNLYNMDKTTWQEVLAELYNTVANVENKFDLFEIKFGSLVGEQVTKELKKMYDDGSLASLINELLNDIKAEVSGQLDVITQEVDKKMEDIEQKLNDIKAEVSGQLDVITQEVDKKTEDIEQKLNETNTNIEGIKDSLLTSVNVERSEILKNKQVCLVNGVETAGNSEWHTSSFIDISNGGIIVGYATRKQDGIAFYDEDKNYVASIKPTISTDSNNIFKAEITIEKGQYKYCRVVSVIYAPERQFAGSVTTYANAIETLENRVAILEKNIRIANNLLNNNIATTLPYR